MGRRGVRAYLEDYAEAELVSLLAGLDELRGELGVIGDKVNLRGEHRVNPVNHNPRLVADPDLYGVL